ncbi:helix-turn-helix transcriptional regulator [Streptomyces sp. NPDC049585]|uniref:helix-turn-helix domain-containing protein n=1 Tax=Streptomyces sp. NPDC049585 TaxID=3155154 RepID=UPI0034314885
MPAPKELDPSRSLPALYGAKLRKLRIMAGLTQRELGALVPIAHSRIAQFELGNETPPRHVSDRLDEVLGADGDLKDLWQHASRFPPTDAYRRYKQYEARASALHQYLAHCVPGQLQTEDYARELMTEALPWCTPAEIEERVAARMARKSILTKENPPLVWSILDEAALRRPVGGPTGMRKQLAYLLEWCAAPNIECQVLPFASGCHAAMGGSLTVLSFSNAPDLVYLEGGPGLTEMVTDRQKVAEQSRMYDSVHAAALPPAESFKWIEKVMEEYDRCELT